MWSALSCCKPSIRARLQMVQELAEWYCLCTKYFWIYPVQMLIVYGSDSWLLPTPKGRVGIESGCKECRDSPLCFWKYAYGYIRQNLLSYLKMTIHHSVLQCRRRCTVATIPGGGLESEVGIYPVYVILLPSRRLRIVFTVRSDITAVWIFDTAGVFLDNTYF